MSSKPISPLRQAWYKWKALRLPWRKRFLVGLDLHGNTYWEFKDVAGIEGRWRRIVQYPSSTHYSNVSVPPAWHQWLRNTRPDAPSLAEQSAEVTRQARLKVLAAEADKRWEAKPRYIDTPGQGPTGQPRPTLAVGGDLAQAKEQQAAEAESQGLGAASAGDATEADARGETWRKMREEQSRDGPDPWKQAQRRGGPGEEWQPQGWTPSPAPKKR